MRRLLWLVRSVPGLRHVARALLRTYIALSQSVLPDMGNSLRWLFTSRETTNFTYDLEAANTQFLAANVALMTGRSRTEVQRLFQEVATDRELHEAYSSALARSSLAFITDRQIRLARRMTWYAIARLLRPAVVVETGVDKGLGSLVICAALKRNAAEGFPGRYFGTDINPDAGWLLAGDYKAYGEILVGDSIDSVTRLDCSIDMLVSDSCHDPLYEAREYSAVSSKLSDAFVIISDQGTTALMEAAEANGWLFLSLRERPARTIHEGTDFGIAFPRELPHYLAARTASQ